MDLENFIMVDQGCLFIRPILPDSVLYYFQAPEELKQLVKMTCYDLECEKIENKYFALHLSCQMCMFSH